ncbi:MAG: SOS response-associated peptidase [Wenzhouxiangellaceae bacterium]
MCGRYALFTDPGKISDKLGLPSPPSGWQPGYNIAPGTGILGVRYSESDGRAIFDRLWWGYRPHWADQSAPEPINARAEKLESSRYFRGAFHSHRCLVPADGWYEWQATDKGKQPWFFAREDREPVFMAGIWITNPDDRPSCAIITEPARGEAGDIHSRMPLVLDDGCLQKWLDPQLQDRETLRQSMGRLDPDLLTCWPVSTEVNRTDNDSADLVEPVGQ